jgi:hypothetical protein
MITTLIPRLSVLTVCMNRWEHLRISAAQVSRWPHHHEHLILDWSSEIPVSREELPEDPRIRLHRVEGERRWNLCRAYNFAASLAEGDVLLKLDADCWPAKGTDPYLLMREGPVWMGTGAGGSGGQFLMRRGAFERVGGFNEWMVGWGFDDKDLRARLELLPEAPLATLPSGWVVVISHVDADRVGTPQRGAGARGQQQALAALRASRLHNRLIAAHCPWGPRQPRSRYRPMPSPQSVPVWTAEQITVPVLPAGLERSLAQQRRRTFWDVFLAIPEPAIEALPEKLLPGDCEGRWTVRWWHRLYWLSLRRILMTPVWILGLGRGVGRCGRLGSRLIGGFLK